MTRSVGKTPRLIKINHAIHLVDKLIETIHFDFGLQDREIQPAEVELSKLRMMLENIKLSLERSPR